jgi:hypothetical protein
VNVTGSRKAAKALSDSGPRSDGPARAPRTSRACPMGLPAQQVRQLDEVHRRNFVDYLYVLDAKLLGPPRQEFVELRLGGLDDLVLQHIYQPVD